MEIILDPPRGAAGITIGMAIADAERVLSGIPGYLGPGPARGSRGTADYSSGMTIQAHDDGTGTVEAVEIYRPSDPTVRVVYSGISIFSDPAEVVENGLVRYLRIDVIDDGSTVVAPDAFLAFGKSLSVYGDAVESGFFEWVVVAAPGYYDEPIEPRTSEPRAGLPIDQQVSGQEQLF